MDWYMKVLRQYADFSGRARRKEYWMFFLINFLIACAIGVVEGLLMGATFGFLYMIYTLAVFIPSLAVGVRRLHDIGRSGWWLLIALIPLIGFIVLIVFLVTDSEQGANRYGPNPKAMPTTAAPATA